jgi:hypothetical protein
MFVVSEVFLVIVFYSDKDDEEEGENRTENEIEKNKQVRCVISCGSCYVCMK